MPLSYQLSIACLAFVALFVSARRARELCVLSVRAGRTLQMRGKLPAEARAAIDDVIARARTPRGHVRVLLGDGRATLALRGFDERTAQRLRNVIATFSLPRLRTGQPLRAPNLGQRLGLPWLAWRLARRG